MGLSHSSSPPVYESLVLAYPCNIGNEVDATKPALEDRAQMLYDFKLFKSYTKRGVTFGFADSVKNQYVDRLREFLIGQPNQKNKSISVLCLTGHGLSPHSAEKLRDNPIVYGVRSPYLPFELKNCSKMMGKGYTPYTVTKYASAGDVVAFHSGLLSPKWVLDQLQTRDSKKDDSLVIIIVDACYSGQWVTYFNDKNTCLDHTKVIVQTACNGDEVSYSNLFIPLWIELQNMTCEDIQALSRDDSFEIPLKQTPSLYCGPAWYSRHHQH